VSFPDHGAINVYTGFLLRKVSSASFHAFSELTAAHGLHPMHFGLLTMIEAEEPVSQQELSRRSGIDPSTMVARMDVLVEQGLIERPRSTGDRRSYEIRLSPAGRKTLKALRSKAKEHGERFFAPLTQRERRQLHELLAKLAASLEPEETMKRPPRRGRRRVQGSASAVSKQQS
jgi:DNA-binding MarR family transcriptional regulator